ncbi:putative nuclease HARBI1 [Stylophora pistillata]|uniref:Putative nuclease HARBI1 n=1 Tax=Stylophora pistillata TaxID=50429 RepID=A0A2B4S6T9_STYPI|nr:putative nuclease HARBI1 [Stylophora pistillata]
MDRIVFMKLVDELYPYLRPGRSPRGDDVLSVEKQIGMTLYYLKDQGSLYMTANSFGVSKSTASVVIRKVCDVITATRGPKYIKLPSNVKEMATLVKGIEDKYGFPQAFGCIDGTHIEIQQLTENPHDYYSYKQKYTINTQAVCDWNGRFLDVEVKWPGSVQDGRVFSNSRINRLLREEKLPMMYKQILPGYDKVPATLIGDPAYPLLPYCMKEYASPRSNEEIDEDIVSQQIALERLQANNNPD